MFSIMIVEDDETIAQSLKQEAEQWGYSAYISEDFSQITEIVMEKSPQLILMDIQLPTYNGYYWCQEIRKFSEVPIIFVSSRTDNMDIVMAIQMGADDYIQKPFNLSVVMAKIQAILRRTYDFNETQDFLMVNEVILKSNTSSIVYQEQEVELTRTELKIMEILFRQKGDYVTRESIMTSLWEDESFIDENTLAVNITRLRKKLKSLGQDQLITTKKGVGYAVGRNE
ncbi:response regulator transcription factor [Marinilactibacillus psychrotolerans]|uniref:Response regulator transcription factor n=2 Tax=Marinilactibacillus psychrotolerans TaxID=191770 RepID=A0A511H0L2_9LACT|nr:response regulator transcription factor [Marinilactibacillus psychrotolerans]TLQ06189.1 response regulator transcription factor [Marinilactibacillus psychrotolerans]SDC78420.1 Transcriptional regulatory protein, C terminal [Marinilactibacillus psychrotolerans]SJN38985.1 Two-component response regulator [Marinilactibacillus psychrotolerans 42ea]GEL67067.1 DNA-binding response regulator [Marinilactibacillus psychrotolerans]GEQ34472.1 two-component system response regulator [Marinilactibacillu